MHGRQCPLVIRITAGWVPKRRIEEPGKTNSFARCETMDFRSFICSQIVSMLSVGLTTAQLNYFS